jgi:hypothetical protein
LAESGASRAKSPAKKSSWDSGHSFQFHQDTRARIVVVKFGKKVSADVIGMYANNLRLNESFEPTFSEIVDLTEVEVFDLKVEDFLKLADKIDPFVPEAKRAFVVRTPVQSHAARLHKILRVERNIEIFGSLLEAERWIGI